MEFTNPWGLYALGSLIPLIIIYLIRPKPVEKIIPSLMFIIQEKKVTRRQAFFRRFVNNLIFFLQFLALTALAFAVASPFITIPFATSSENTVLVIDGSASMQASHGLGTRFTSAVSGARDSVAGKVSIILAENIPNSLLAKGSKSEALSVLGKLKPKATSTNIGDALLMANDMLGTEKGKIIVFSDFLSTEGSDIMVAKRRLEASGHAVEFRDLSSEADNAGIIGADVSRALTKLKVKNFNREGIGVSISVLNEGKKIDEASISIQPDSIEELSFTTPRGKTEIVIDRKDDFMLDNRVFISNPFKQKTKVLLVSNLEDDNYVGAAMEASPDVALETRMPPTINPERLDHEIIIVNEVDRQLLVPGDFELISRHIKNGASIVIMAQDELSSIALSDLLPVTIGSKQKSSPVCVQITNRFTKHLSNACFTSSPYFDLPANQTSVIASTENDVPVITMREHGNGKVVYYGIFDRESDFKSSEEYPIFWAELIGFLSGTEDIRNFNLRTGDILPVLEQEIETPGGKLTANRVDFDETGFYSFSGREYSANLINEKESNVGAINLLKSEKAALLAAGEEESEKEVSLDLALIGLIALLLFAELFIVKFRGDA
ncbi:MAG TPA: BatA and WFA domain-containing protein [Candidatus Nanoarchaeia archaeon]|nr:BatA and WFA domain-containing protein [Candidatus Nanoarchaeia archaeon]